jgi:hypothetical protein
MKTIITSLFLIAACFASAEVTWEAQLGRDIFKFTISQEQFDKLPVFDPRTDDNPALSRPKALEIANKQMDTIPAPDGMKWEVSSISLYHAKEHFTRPGKWLWRVRFSVSPTQLAGGFVGVLPEHELAVLMDGTPITGKK